MHSSQTEPWNLRSHRVRGVRGLASRSTRGNVMPAPGRYAPPPVPPPRPGPRPDPWPEPIPVPVPVPAPRALPGTRMRHCRSGSCRAASSGWRPCSSRECSAPRVAEALGSSTFGGVGAGFFSTGMVIFSLPGSSTLRGGSGDLLPPPPPPPPGPGSAIQTMRSSGITSGVISAAGARAGSACERQQPGHDVRAHGRTHSDARAALLEREMHVNWPVGPHMERTPCLVRAAGAGADQSSRKRRLPAIVTDGFGADKCKASATLL